MVCLYRFLGKMIKLQGRSGYLFCNFDKTYYLLPIFYTLIALHSAGHVEIKSSVTITKYPSIYATQTKHRGSRPWQKYISILRIRLLRLTIVMFLFMAITATRQLQSSPVLPVLPLIRILKKKKRVPDTLYFSLANIS